MQIQKEEPARRLKTQDLMGTDTGLNFVSACSCATPDSIPRNAAVFIKQRLLYSFSHEIKT